MLRKSTKARKVRGAPLNEREIVFSFKEVDGFLVLDKESGQDLGTCFIEEDEKAAATLSKAKDAREPKLRKR